MPDVPNAQELMGRMSKIAESAKAMSARMAELVGTGTAADERVTVTVGPTGVLQGLVLDSKAMRLPSEDLAAAILEAARLAADDAAARMKEVLAEFDLDLDVDVTSVAQGRFDPGADFETRMAKVTEALNAAR